MASPDAPMVQPKDILFAMGLLSRIPVKVNTQDAADRGAAVVWAFPLVGAAIGLIAWLAAVLAQWLGFPPVMAAAMVLVATVMATGAMHEDGLADTADGLWGGFDKSRRLAIMKDSTIGVYGMVALGLALILRWGALYALISADMGLVGFIAYAGFSRAPMALMMSQMANARQDGLSASVGAPGLHPALLALAIGVGFLWLGLGFAGTFHALFLVAIFVGGLALLASRKIQGQTGDILGASQQLAEIAVLTALISAQN